MIGLAYLDEGARNFFTADRPVRRLEDMKGLKIRVQVASMMGDTVEALGAEAVPLPMRSSIRPWSQGPLTGRRTRR